MEPWVPEMEENSYLMALLYINVINSSHAISSMSKTSNMKDHLNQGRFISYIQKIYLKFFNNWTVHANFSVQTAVHTCNSFIPLNMNSKFWNMYCFSSLRCTFAPLTSPLLLTQLCIPLPYSALIPPTLSCRCQYRHASMDRQFLKWVRTWGIMWLMG